MTRPSPSGLGGHLVGVGVGPGDPELLTLQALRVLREADRVVAPTVDTETVGRAEWIVHQALPGLRVVRLPFAMVPPTEAEARAAAHATAAEALITWLDVGETVAFVTLGDPNVYSTFSSLVEEVLARRPSLATSTVTGVCAFQALAALTGTVLLDGDEAMTLVSALDEPERLEHALQDPAMTVVVYKGGRYLARIKELAALHGRLAHAVSGELLGMAGQKVGGLAATAEGPASYLATVIIPPAHRTTAVPHPPGLASLPATAPAHEVEVHDRSAAVRSPAVRTRAER